MVSQVVKSIAQKVIKWLVIAGVSLTVLAAILLGLGYLLTENEKEVRALKAELERVEEEKVKKESRFKVALATSEDLPASKPDTTEKHNQQLATTIIQTKKLDSIKQIIVDNLVCMNVEQCRLVDTANIELGCVVAVNSIGQSKLNKFNFSVRDRACEERIEELSLTCHHNICSIK